MHQETLKAIVDESERLLLGRFVGKVVQLSNFSLAIDFGLKDKRFLFVSIDPSTPRLYLIKRSVRELEKASEPIPAFTQAVRSTLGGNKLISFTKDADERVVRFTFQGTDALSGSEEHSLVAQLTGRSANLFLLDSDSRITHAWRTPHGPGHAQQIGELYQCPQLKAQSTPTRTYSSADQLLQTTPATTSISEIADNYYRRLEEDQAFKALAASLVGKLGKEIAKREKLKANLQNDLIAHGTPDTHKRLGDLLLANLANAKRERNKVSLKDYYSDGAPTIEIEVDENTSLQEAAAESFSRYTKAKRAVEEIATRLAQIDRELTALDERKVQLDSAIANRDLNVLSQFEGQRQTPPASRKKEKASQTLPGMRRYRSSDGYEVLVGRTARDNDQLTFRVARPNDLWLHAGDYPGSHVIVRNSSRNDIPHRTIIEAAQLAAKFSQASKDSKVAIHYTRRKFLSKPKGAATGLVRLSTFKTITVEPAENLERVK